MRKLTAFTCPLELMLYAEAWERQKVLHALRRQGIVPDFLLTVEHPHTYTCGRTTRSDHMGSDGVSLEAGAAEVFSIERGGSVTYHGPGQLVGYPIIDLRRRGRDVHRYVRELEKVLILTLAGFGLKARRRPGLTGVWVERRKIAAIGIYVRQWITMHGFALNVCPDLGYFRKVSPCGLDGNAITSMAELLSRPPVLKEVEGELKHHFAAVFGWELEEVGLEALLARSGENL